MSEPRPAPTRPDPLPLPVVDDHAHLDVRRDDDVAGAGEDLAAHVERLVADARAVGVDRIVQIGCDLASAEETVRLVDVHPALLGGVALHPNEAPLHAERGDLDEAYATIERLAAHPRIRVVGETGLDYYRTGEDGRDVQQESFRWHIDLAKRTGKVLQIHDRDAHDDVMRTLAEEGAPERTVLHCFSGDVTMARECVERGYYLSFAGTVTFKNARDLRDALAVVPADRVLVETDTPYLTPVPHRGAANAPMLVAHTVRTVADVLTMSVADLCRTISATAEELYGPW
ncbi:TatD family hydrolase [Mobilicoccus pelagius]|uniref:Putative deoxyribonuclease n=1 Tax=Mobilicoccus pelagius NBRC 104925 TaxID=1089455 RepID=H5USH6_9MICO|nr:TatD family hydrolase [Mobilicoccus pelagius]GAB48684.1 putative deoxyribonuclease [Mobilicoccus pelagius NBRC 104925]